MADTTFVNGTVIVPDWLNDVNNVIYRYNASSTYPAGIGEFLNYQHARTAAEIAAGVTPTNYAYFPGDVRRYGAVGNGTTDDTAAISASIASNSITTFPSGTFLVTSKLTLNAGKRIVGAGRTLTTLKLGFNGSMLSMSGYSQIRSIGMEGQGGTYAAGKGVVWEASGTPMCVVDDCKIINFGGYCVHFEVDSAGTQATISNCDIYRFVSTNAGIGFPTTEAYGPARRLINIQCSGGVLADLAASDNTMVIGCQANGINYQSGGSSSTRTKKALVVGNRFSTVGTPITILGEGNVFTGNCCAGGVTFGSGALACTASGNVIVDPYVDSSGSTGTSANSYDAFVPQSSYAVSWTGSVTNPAIGNGTLVSTYNRIGNRIQVNISLTIGSTTTFGSGTWSFSLPSAVASAVGGFVVGQARIAQTGFTAGIVLGTAGASTVQVYANGATTAVSGTSPAAWTTGHTLFLTVEYPVT